MKNKLLLFATFILVSLSAVAHTNKSDYNIYRGYGDSFTFVEDGVTFAVFQNGEFDFYIDRHNRGGINVGYYGKNISISFNSGYNYDAYVQYDRYGAVIQVEHVPIYYDYYGRVTQIGRVDIDYRRGNLRRVGGLYVHYNRYNHYSHYTGYINDYNRYYNYHRYHDYFVRPSYDYRIVSHTPYRHYYSPVRYKYNDYNKRYKKYYKQNKKYHKYNNRNRRNYSRIATSEVPKRRTDRIARAGNKKFISNTDRNKRYNRNTTTSRDYDNSRNKTRRSAKHRNSNYSTQNRISSTKNYSIQRDANRRGSTVNLSSRNTTQTHRSVKKATRSIGRDYNIRRTPKQIERNTRINKTPRSSARVTNRNSQIRNSETRKGTYTATRKAPKRATRGTLRNNR